MDKHLTKTITYRLGAVSLALLIVYAMTHQLYLTGKLVLVLEVVDTLFYFGHEKLWHKKLKYLNGDWK